MSRMFKSLTRAERWGLRAWGVVCLLLLGTLAWAQQPAMIHRGWWFAAMPHGTQADFVFQTKTATAGHKVLSVLDDSGTEVWNITREGSTLHAGGEVRCTSIFSATSGSTAATLTSVPGLSLNLVAGVNYIVTGKLFTSSTTNSGLKLGFGGTATASAILTETKFYNSTTLNTSTQQTSLGALAGATVATDSASFQAYIACNGSGTLLLQAAQNASHADTTSVKVGSYMAAAIVN